MNQNFIQNKKPTVTLLLLACNIEAIDTKDKAYKLQTPWKDVEYVLRRRGTDVFRRGYLTPSLDKSYIGEIGDFPIHTDFHFNIISEQIK